MAETKTTPVFDLVKCKAHLDAVEKAVLAHAGKQGHNPYLWLNTNVQPLRMQLAANVKTLELQNKILALKAVEPKV